MSVKMLLLSPRLNYQLTFVVWVQHNCKGLFLGFLELGFKHSSPPAALCDYPISLLFRLFCVLELGSFVWYSPYKPFPWLVQTLVTYPELNISGFLCWSSNWFFSVFIFLPVAIINLKDINRKHQAVYINMYKPTFTICNMEIPCHFLSHLHCGWILHLMLMSVNCICIYIFW